ncbi:two-component system, sensor histidine kinase YesM [Clostridium cavendishii DSM 21758]|uniref:histidine kinase n=1 Tax=Clostridium cavendishii DSM 21758 TaxID=1121302 RepID=A0A1M6G6I0_9CLOT|nr:sensor histidine kinase [Clostridium cavendishii]SHJ05552.1 two-component system, sensor histidine kinase YesM [Clostridium cavendishii DSM 21758]
MGSLSTKKTSIRNKLVMFFLISSVMSTVVLGSISYIVSVKVIKKKSIDSSVKTLTHVRDIVDKQTAALTQVADEIFVNKSINRVLSKAYSNTIDYNMDMREVYEFYENFKKYSAMNQYISSIVILGDNEKVIKLGDNAYTIDEKKLKESEYYKKARELDGKILWTGTHEDWAELKGDGYLVSAVRLIKDENLENGIGVAFLSFKESSIYDLFKGMEESTKNSMVIVNEDANVISNTNRQLLTEKFDEKDYIKEVIKSKEGYITSKADNQEILITYCSAVSTPWKLIEITEVKNLVKENKIIAQITFIVSLISIVVSCIFWWFISAKLTKPINNLKNTMKLVEGGVFDARADESERDEIGELAHSFNFMLDEIKKLLEVSLKEEGERKDAEYKALLSQINPHFLYNTLNTIKWMAIMQNADNIRDMTTCLGRLLQKSIKNVDNFVSIDEELSLVEDYIYIQKFRYKDKFNINYEVSEEVRYLYTPKFILQPAIENSIFHGIEPKEEDGLINLSVDIEEDKVVFKVEDDGVGMDESKVLELLSKDNHSGRGFSGLGVRNIDERIKSLFGKEFGVDIQSKIGEGTVVIITIPVLKSEEKSNF